MLPLLSLLLPLLGAGCVTYDRYLVSPALLAEVAALDGPGRSGVAIAAVKEQDRKRAYLRGSALPPATLAAARLAEAPPPASSAPLLSPPGAAPPPASSAPLLSPPGAAPPPVALTLRGRNRLVTAGAVLVYVGSVLSVAGTIWFLATLKDGGDLNVAGALLALGAEPPMWVGTVLWPLGLMRPPYEARPGDRALRYLEEPRAPASALRLRF